jgi:hypothetical protein
MQHAQLVSELYDDYTVYFPKCYRYFIKENAVPNNHYLIVNNDKVHYSNSKETIYIDELADISNCYVCLRGGQTREKYLLHLFQYLIKRYKWTEDILEAEYKKIENN